MARSVIVVEPRKSLSASQAPHQESFLPLQETSFIGRERELIEIKRLLATTRLLTLVGSGGCGKTRLVIETVRDLAAAYPGGVHFVDLASLSEQQSLVHHALSQALRIRQHPGQPVLDAIVYRLKFTKSLLILDNCERLIEAVSTLVDELLATCPPVTILATSREPLRVTGEFCYRVPSLAVPEPRVPASLEELASYESVQLYATRAREKVQNFSLTPENVPFVAELCRRLDGIPLAIELGAALAGALSPAQLVERLEEPLDMLSAGRRTAAPRHTTMRATLEWSYRLLAEEEARLFRELSVFAGGFSLEAAEAVCSLRRTAVLLSDLVDRSLVVTSRSVELKHYRMLEPARQYAAELLSASGESEKIRERHARWALSLAEAAGVGLATPEQPLWLEQLEAEHDNLRAALAWALDPEKEHNPQAAALALKMSAALWPFWFARGYLVEGEDWLERILRRTAGSEGATALALSSARARSLNGLGHIRFFKGDYQGAQGVLTEALAWFRSLEDEGGVASALANLGLVSVLGQCADMPANLYVEEALSILPRLTDPRIKANILILAGLRTALLRGDLKEAQVRYEEALSLLRGIGDVWGTNICLINLGCLWVLREGYQRAEQTFTELMILAKSISDKLAAMYAAFGFACLEAARGRPMRAARLWGASEPCETQPAPGRPLPWMRCSTTRAARQWCEP